MNMIVDLLSARHMHSSVMPGKTSMIRISHRMFDSERVDTYDESVQLDAMRP